ncbi:MAG: hypothetical protein ACTHLE_26935 [Agriterribacter sp.]
MTGVVKQIIFITEGTFDRHLGTDVLYNNAMGLKMLDDCLCK